MKIKTGLVILLLMTLAVFTIGAAAQQSEHHSMQGMKSMMPGQMMAHHAEMEKLAGQLVQSFNGLRNEKDRNAFDSKLAKHGALLEQLQSEMKKQSGMMSEHMKNCPMMKSEQPEKK